MSLNAKKSTSNPFSVGDKLRMLAIPLVPAGFILPIINGLASINLKITIYIIITSYGFIICAIYKFNKTNTQMRINEISKEITNEDFLLYLRPFKTSGKVNVPCKLESRVDRTIFGEKWDFELGLSISVWPLMPIVSVGETKQGFGSSKIIESDDTWRDRVLKLTDKSKVIVVMGLYGPATMWEISEILKSHSLIRKTMIIVPPMNIQYIKVPKFIRKNQFDYQYTMLKEELSEIDFIIPKYNRSGFILIFDGRQFIDIPTLDFTPHYIREIVRIMSDDEIYDLEDRVDTILRCHDNIVRYYDLRKRDWLGDYGD